MVKDSGVLDGLRDAVSGLDEPRTRLDAVRSRPARILSDFDWGWTSLFYYGLKSFACLNDHRKSSG